MSASIGGSLDGVGSPQKRGAIMGPSSTSPVAPLSLSTTPPSHGSVYDYEKNYNNNAEIGSDKTSTDVQSQGAIVGTPPSVAPSIVGFTPYTLMQQTNNDREVVPQLPPMGENNQYQSPQQIGPILLQGYQQELPLQQVQISPSLQSSPQPPPSVPSPNNNSAASSPHGFNSNGTTNAPNSNLSMSCSPTPFTTPATTPPTSSPTPSPASGWGTPPPPAMMLPPIGNGGNTDYSLDGGGTLMPVQYPRLVGEEVNSFPFLDFNPDEFADIPKYKNQVSVSPNRADFYGQKQPNQPQILHTQQLPFQQPLLPPIQGSLNHSQTPSISPQWQQLQQRQQPSQLSCLRPLSQVPPLMEYLSEHSTPTPPAATPPPTPPPPSFSAGRVNTSVSSSHSTIESRTTQPAFRQQSNNPMELRLLGVPQKSRVETQIRLCVQLVASSGQIGGGLRWKYLYLPPDMCNNDLRSVNTHSSSSSSLKGHDLSTTLNVQTKVLCASDNREVLMCMGCVQRERRSLERKKHNITPSPSQPSSRPSTPSLNSAGVSGAWPEMIDQEQRKIVQFHSSPLIDFTSGEAIISLRITCYCRHHNEKVGFRIHLSLVDPITGELVASSVSSPVLITDDHKTSVKRTAKRPRIDPDYEDKHTTPVIQKVIPNIGPIAGGIEVTLLGTGFSSSNLVHFGPYIALSLNCWNATTIVCTLPPSGKAGTVHVTINGNESSANEPALFTYRDDSDQRLLEIALQLIGLKFSGRVESPKSVAMQILSIGQTSTSTTTSTIQENINQVSALPPQGLEKVVLNAMRLIDNMEGNAIDVSLEDNFHRNILHYASIKGFADLLGWCLQKAPALSVVNSKDSMGNSPLHYSCFYAHPQTTKLLLSHQADMSSCNLSGCTPCDMAQHATSSSTLIAPSLPQLRHHIPSATRRTSQTLPYPPQRLPPILSAAPTSTANLPPFANSPFQHHLSSQPAIKAERKSITKVGEYIISVESAANHTKPPFTETLAETRADIALNLHILETIEDDPERPLNTEIAIETTNKTTRYLADQNIDPVLEPSGKKGSYSLLELQPLERTTLHFTKPSFSRAGHPQYSSSKSNLKVTTSNKRTSCPRTRKLNGSKNPYAAVCTSPTTADTRQKKLSKLEQIRKTLDKPSSYLELSTTCETKQPCNETELSTAYLSVSFEDPVTSQFSLNNDAEIPQTEYGTTKGRKFKTFFRGEWWQRQAPKALLVAGLGIVGICAVVGLLMGPVGFSWNGTDHLVHSSESVDPGHSNKVALYYSLLCAVCISAVATLVIAYRWVGQESKPGRGRLILGSLLISCAAFDVLLLSGFFVALFTGK